MTAPEGSMEDSAMGGPQVLGGTEVTDKRGKTSLRGPFYCSVCPMLFPYKSQADLHVKTHMEIKIPCSFCNKKYKSIYTLKYHIQGTHQEALYMVPQAISPGHHETGQVHGEMRRASPEEVVLILPGGATLQRVPGPSS